jgi:hypothetical protein
MDDATPDAKKNSYSSGGVLVADVSAKPLALT